MLLPTASYTGAGHVSEPGSPRISAGFLFPVSGCCYLPTMLVGSAKSWFMCRLWFLVFGFWFGGGLVSLYRRTVDGALGRWRASHSTDRRVHGNGRAVGRGQTRHRPRPDLVVLPGLGRDLPRAALVGYGAGRRAACSAAGAWALGLGLGLIAGLSLSLSPLQSPLLSLHLLSFLSLSCLSFSFKYGD